MGVKCILQDQIPSLSEVGGSNPNLLDNWYFANPVDQRRGYLAPPDTPYYSDTSLSTQVGVVNTYYTEAVYINGVYGSIIVDDTTYYVDWSEVVRGYANLYTSGRLGVDRWSLVRANMILVDGAICASPTKSDPKYPTGYFVHRVNRDVVRPFFGQEVTISCLIDGQLYYTSGILGSENISITIPSGLCYINLSSGGECDFDFQFDDAPMNIEAVKFEPGSKQTLAYQDVQGNWVLKDSPPSPAVETAKCQMYQFQCFTPESGKQGYVGSFLATSTTYAFGLVPTPVSMRKIPTLVSDISATTPYNAFGDYTTGYSAGVGVITQIVIYSRTSHGIILRVTGSNFVPGNVYTVYVDNQIAHRCLFDAN